jgi:hypothetical protein
MAKTVKLTAQEFQEKHARRLKAAVPDIQAGVNRVTEAPGVKAAEKVDKWHAAISAQETKDKWQRRVASVSVDQWKSHMLSKGVPRIAAGIDGAADKVVEFAEKLIAHENAGLVQIERMPDLTLEDSISRATTWIRHMSNFKR